MEKEKEPGSARLGNFINYYSFNPPERRLQLVPKNLLRECCDSFGKHLVVALDIGSNAGDLTLALYKHLTADDDLGKTADSVAADVHILGVEIDPVLVQRSIQSNCFENNVFFRAANILCDEDRHNIVNGFLLERNKTRFNMVFCFSVTMWIHLNHGDDGLRNFLQYMASITDFLLIEPQPWRCYQTAARRMRKLGCAPFEHMATLQWRDCVADEIVNYLESDSCSMKHVQNFGHTESWERPLYLFRSLKER